MSTTVWTVQGMTCQHCVTAVTEEVSLIPGVTAVAVELESGQVTVTTTWWKSPCGAISLSQSYGDGSRDPLGVYRRRGTAAVTAPSSVTSRVNVTVSPGWAGAGDTWEDTSFGGW